MSQFYLDRSDLLRKLSNYIVLCDDTERDVAEELQEILCEAIKGSGKKLVISIEEE